MRGQMSDGLAPSMALTLSVDETVAYTNRRLFCSRDTARGTTSNHFLIQLPLRREADINV
jgi:hypothetical protein